jgi:G-protein alpha subunit
MVNRFSCCHSINLGEGKFPMGGRQCKQAYDDAHWQEKIDEQVERNRKKRKRKKESKTCEVLPELKLLALGTCAAGKSTLAMQMCERQVLDNIDSCRNILLSNLKQLIEVAFQCLSRSESASELAHFLRATFPSERGDDLQELLTIADNRLSELTRHVVKNDDDSHDSVQRRRRQLANIGAALFRRFTATLNGPLCVEWLRDSAALDVDYLMHNCERLADAPLQWSDALSCRVRTSGIVERAVCDGVAVVDVGGPRNERRKWVHCFQDSTILFVASALDVMLVLCEDESRCRWDDTCDLLGEVARLRFFDSTPCFVVLSHVDTLWRLVQSGGERVRAHVRASFERFGMSLDDVADIYALAEALLRSLSGHIGTGRAARLYGIGNLHCASLVRVATDDMIQFAADDDDGVGSCSAYRPFLIDGELLLRDADVQRYRRDATLRTLAEQAVARHIVDGALSDADLEPIKPMLLATNSIVMRFL